MLGTVRSMSIGLTCGRRGVAGPVERRARGRPGRGASPLSAAGARSRRCPSSGSGAVEACRHRGAEVPPRRVGDRAAASPTIPCAVRFDVDAIEDGAGVVARHVGGVAGDRLVRDVSPPKRGRRCRTTAVRQRRPAGEADGHGQIVPAGGVGPPARARPRSPAPCWSIQMLTELAGDSTLPATSVA